MGFYKDHQKLLKKIMIAIQKEYPNAKLFERHVGMFRLLRSEAVVKINKKGMADLWMLYEGIHIEIEVKTLKAKQTKEQKLWEKIVNETGSYYLVMRQVEDIKLIKQILQPL